MSAQYVRTQQQTNTIRFYTAPIYITALIKKAQNAKKESQ